MRIQPLVCVCVWCVVFYNTPNKKMQLIFIIVLIIIVIIFYVFMVVKNKQENKNKHEQDIYWSKLQCELIIIQHFTIYKNLGKTLEESILSFEKAPEHMTSLTEFAKTKGRTKQMYIDTYESFY